MAASAEAQPAPRGPAEKMEVMNMENAVTGKTLIGEIVNQHPEAVEILLRIDPEPIDGLNLILRLVALITDIGKNNEVRGFFGYAEQAKTDSESGGSATENTEVAGK